MNAVLICFFGIICLLSIGFALWYVIDIVDNIFIDKNKVFELMKTIEIKDWTKYKESDFNGSNIFEKKS